MSAKKTAKNDTKTFMLLELRHDRAMSHGYGQVQRTRYMGKGNGNHQMGAGIHSAICCASLG